MPPFWLAGIKLVGAPCTGIPMDLANTPIFTSPIHHTNGASRS
ncbi:uncharacterized protein CCOS01_06998 [Colletotrichum costaricense]|uniref:Uncharacterized protein n=1 Tax=Colletotrichum costaricense TaxID=1209916 RepID=A0AAI9YZ54_9PEZI|nr:uncharacterized protein CCOS01_06998 [Colletotrichum costaricense]KAK1529164.1 hypothetical protein CCOS01_06998 [Colletotrichum costaricense]